MRRAVLCWALLVGTFPCTEAWALEARKPPPKAQPKRKNPPAHKKSTKRISAPAETVEEELHSERLAILGRLKEVNEGVRDAELAATIRRLDDLEGKRHTLAQRLIARAHDQDKEEAPK